MPHVQRIHVSADDIDELGHVSNLVYLRWVQQAAASHSAALGLGLDAYLGRGAAFVVRRHSIDYLRPAFLGEWLEVETRVVAFTAATSERRTVIRRVDDGAVIARVATLWAWLDLERNQPGRIPEDVRTRFPVEHDPGE